MKVILSVILICLLAIAVSAQPDKQAKSHPKAKKSGPANLMLPAPSPEVFKPAPRDSLKYKKQPRFRHPERWPDQPLAETTKPADNMPIIRSPKGHFPPMPVYKPDTTIHYTLKIKKPGK